MALDDTRQRLIDTAARLFAQHGFDNVTVRDICDKARANVASVNYHFHNKQGLYLAVVDKAVEAMQAVDAKARAAGEGQPPEQRLRLYIRAFLQRLVAIGHDSWIHQLIRHEFSQPTPALDVLIERGLRPRFEYLGGLVGTLLGGRSARDPRVLRCITSIQSQFLMMVPSPAFSRLYEKFNVTPPTVDELAEHITEFSLAGVRALAKHERSGTRAAKPARTE